MVGNYLQLTIEKTKDIIDFITQRNASDLISVQGEAEEREAMYKYLGMMLNEKNKRKFKYLIGD